MYIKYIALFKATCLITEVKQRFGSVILGWGLRSIYIKIQIFQ